jgi:hypothetical protein
MLKASQMSEELNNIDQVEVVLRQMYLDGKIDDDKYFAGLISIASQYCMLDKKAECKELISRLSSDFLNDVLLDYLKQDAILRVKALAVAEYLSEDMKEINTEEDAIDMMLAKMDHRGKPS